MSIPRSIWLVRHGQTDWNLSWRYLSHTDRPLTPFGRRQTAALGAFFASRKVDAIVHTGLARTEQAAIAIAGSRSMPMLADQRWREASHGNWEGLTYREVRQRYPDEATLRFADPVGAAPTEGESLADLSRRVETAWRLLSEQFAGQRVVIVTHATPIQAILCMLTGVPLHEHWRWRIDLGAATGVDCYPGATILRAINLVPAFR